MRRLCCLVALASLVGCTAPPPVSESEALVGGVGDPVDPAVVLVVVHFSDNTQDECSGSLVSQWAVLTAAHCFVGGTVTSVDIGFDSSYSLPVGKATTADHFVMNPAYDPSQIQGGHDTAIVVLADASNLAPLPYHAAAPDSSWIGQAVRLVGYGKTAANKSDDGTRRTVSTTLGGIDAVHLVLDSGKQNCATDSGGPMLKTLNGVETIVGVASTSTPDCVTHGYYNRIDTDLTFINDAVASSGSSGGSSGGGGTGGTQMGGGGCNVLPTRAPPSVGALFFALFAFACLRRRRALLRRQ